MKNNIKLFTIFLFGATIAFADNEVFDGQDVSGEDFSGSSYKNSSWVGVSAIGTIFSNGWVSGASSIYTDSNFSNADLSDASFSGANLENANFTNANLSGVNFKYVKNLTDTQLRSAVDITKINLNAVNISNFNLSGLNLSDSDLSFTNVQNVDFTNTNLSGINLNGIVNLTDRQLRSASNISKMDFGNLNLNGFDLSGLNLCMSIFSSGRLIKTDFSNANLRSSLFYNTSLLNANFTNADVSQIYFTNANLQGANFTSANLSNSKFLAANVKNTNFANANLSGADLYRIKNLTDIQLRSASDITNIRFGDLADFDLSGLDLTGANFYIASSVLTRVNFSNSNLTDACWSNSTLISIELRGATIKSSGTSGHVSDIPLVSKMQNVIWTDGIIKNFSMESASDNFTIRKYIPATSGGEMISAKVSESDATVSGGATLKLDTGARLDVVNKKTLTIAENGVLVIDTSLSDPTQIYIESLAGLVIDGKLTVNITEDLLDNVEYRFDLISFESDSNIASLKDLKPDESLYLTIKGKTFNGYWSCEINENKFTILATQVPEPATVAAIFGALALGLAVYRKRR